ncbi:hypothetical protein Fmac_023714 [Flemingia macrophylla]|uniref:Uncharacterized protein n=1 Tax=Flemingia macrophylla TaxID=520843 RepID=A0ABD1LMA7_9FABA
MGLAYKFGDKLCNSSLSTGFPRAMYDEVLALRLERANPTNIQIVTGAGLP